MKIRALLLLQLNQTNGKRYSMYLYTHVGKVQWHYYL